MSNSFKRGNLFKTSLIDGLSSTIHLRLLAAVSIIKDFRAVYSLYFWQAAYLSGQYAAHRFVHLAVNRQMDCMSDFPSVLSSFLQGEQTQAQCHENVAHA